VTLKWLINLIIIDGSKTNYNPTSAGKLRYPSTKIGQRAIEKEEKLKEKIKEIVQKHQTHLQPVEIIESAEDINIATDVSVILDEKEDYQWNYLDEEDQKKIEENLKKRDQRRKESQRLAEEIKALRMMRHLSASQVKRHSIFSDHGKKNERKISSNKY